MELIGLGVIVAWMLCVMIKLSRLSRQIQQVAQSVVKLDRDTGKVLALKMLQDLKSGASAWHEDVDVNQRIDDIEALHRYAGTHEERAEIP